MIGGPRGSAVNGVPTVIITSDCRADTKCHGLSGVVSNAFRAHVAALFFVDRARDVGQTLRGRRRTPFMMPWRCRRR